MDSERDLTEVCSSRASDRFLPRAVSGDMVLINTGSSPFSSPKSGRDSKGKLRSALWKNCVRSPQRMLTFGSDEPSSSSNARREAFSARDLAADTPIAEADVLKQLSDERAEQSSRGTLSETSCPSHHRRMISRQSFQTLNVPGVVDDFYMSPLDWSSSNLIVVSLLSGIHMWDANTTFSYRFTDKEEAQKNPVTSLAWRKGSKSEELAEGLASGIVRLRDTVKETIVDNWEVHSMRIGTCAWSPKGDVIATGSKDHTVGIIDPRQQHPVSSFTGHSQEVCGVKWDPEGVLLATGGNDNCLILWDHRMMNTPLHMFENAHCAAIKALAWSPHRRGRLVSGGGTADRRLRFWDVETLSCIGEVDSGSQVCNVAWSENIDEIVSAHGFSQNQIVVWDTSAATSAPSGAVVPRPAMPIATLRGHKSRVLHLAVSPDGRTVATCAADYNLRFWNVFPGRNAPLMMSLSPVKSRQRSMKQTVKTSAVKQEWSDSQLLSSSVDKALMSECSLNYR